ncbi:hypothetical protein LTR62_001774 [Meristemomyces frigidus]|uniref:Uncharacterized protein n=1 Tax=Meristemomyces frigidus TaxID=1508187 RepID=A0AAN7TN49_9PEZI|nr:hypothetical protein LTR62_001774 [Meristemomyces frigidus]
MATPAANPLRTYIITGAVAAITATGAWYGAGLKTRREYGQERKAILEAPVSERIDQMEMAKARLLTQRAELQKKIDRLTAKAADAQNAGKSPSAG